MMKSSSQQPTGSQPGVHTGEAIHPDTRLGLVRLRVADLNRSVGFYQNVVGLQLIDQQRDSAALGVDKRTLVELHALPGAEPAPARSTGLFHVAFLLPTQAALGHALQRMIAAGVPVGQGDHLVSEALYLADPDGNGIEIYRDRPRNTWHWQNGQVQMATDPVDLDGLLAAAEHDRTAAVRVPAETMVGHVHLKVADIREARTFFQDVLGFNVTAEWPGALFVGAGGYHHHFGLNTWYSRGAAPAPAGTAGLLAYSIALPDVDALGRVVARLDAAGIGYSEDGGQVVLHDPWNNQLVLAVEPVPGQ